MVRKEWLPLVFVVTFFSVLGLQGCPDTEPGNPYPDLEDVPLVIQEYLVDQLGPCNEIWSIDHVCDEGFCNVHLMCQANDTVNTITSVNLALYCVDLESDLDDPFREPCVIAPLF